MTSTLLQTSQRSPKTFAEFFAGIGLVHEGLRSSGWQCIYANDIEPKKREMYSGHFGMAPYYHLGDIWDTNSVLSRLTTSPFLATASFPCIDLSLAGYWKGFDGEHSSTYFGFLKALEALGTRRPKVVMLENVYGFLTSRDGEDFKRAVQELAELGYWIDALVLDAKKFVPQSRPRTFVFGFHESLHAPLIIRRSKSLPLFNRWAQAIDETADLRPEPLRRAFDGIALSTGFATLPFRSPGQVSYKLADLIDVDVDQDWWSSEEISKHYLMMGEPSKARVDALVREGVDSIGAAFRRTRRGKTRTEVRFDMAGCLRTPKGGSAKQIIIAISAGRLRMRWMSASEYARLQGAGGYRIVVNESQAMYGFGDAVCVPAIRWIDTEILTPVFESSFPAAASA